jgi:restriction system protein
MNKLPTREQLLNPVMIALNKLGGSGSVDEINETTISNLKIPEHLVSIPHDKSKQDGRTELEYELAWARTMLKANGYIINSRRGVWAIVDKSNIQVKEIDISKNY